MRNCEFSRAIGLWGCIVGLNARLLFIAASEFSFPSENLSDGEAWRVLSFGSSSARPSVRKSSLVEASELAGSLMDDGVSMAIVAGENTTQPFMDNFLKIWLNA